MTSNDLPMPDYTKPTPAGVYDYLLGGKDNSPADRQAAEAVLATAPEMRSLAAENRGFLGRAVKHICEDGAQHEGQDECQLLDLGTGMPTQDNVHLVARRVAPTARVVCVDSDPTVTAHARALLEGDGQTAYINADIRDVDAVLGSRETQQLIDFGRPVAVLMVALLHFIPDTDNPAELVRRYLGAVPSGSYLVLSHVTRDGTATEVRERINAVYGESPNPLQLRSEREILAMFDGLQVLEPGLVDVANWRPADGAKEPGPLRVIGAVARKG
jgi:hypothetical protein